MSLTVQELLPLAEAVARALGTSAGHEYQAQVLQFQTPELALVLAAEIERRAAGFQHRYKVVRGVSLDIADPYKALAASGKQLNIEPGILTGVAPGPVPPTDIHLFLPDSFELHAEQGVHMPTAYRMRGLRPASVMELAALNNARLTLASTNPNATIVEAEKSCFVLFGVRHGTAAVIAEKRHPYNWYTPGTWLVGVRA